MGKKGIIHKLYRLIGSLVCRCVGVFQDMRDLFSRPKNETILFVAHPDDDALFFHSYILEKKPYIVLLFTGWSLRRLRDFLGVMKKYGVRCRVFDTLSAKAYADAKRREKTRQNVEHCLKKGNFRECLTHSATGEYGHSTHRLVHEVVCQVVGDSMPVFVPVDRMQIQKYPLSANLVKSKTRVFTEGYKSEQFVMNEYKDWFLNEKIIRYSNEKQ